MDILQVIYNNKREIKYVPKEEIVSCSLSFLSDDKYRLCGAMISFDLKSNSTISFDIGKNILIRGVLHFKTQEYEEKASELHKKIINTFSEYFDDKIKTFFMNGERGVFDQNKLEEQYLLAVEKVLDKEYEGLAEKTREM